MFELHGFERILQEIKYSAGLRGNRGYRVRKSLEEEELMMS